jgi:hypothetical protein
MLLCSIVITITYKFCIALDRDTIEVIITTVTAFLRVKAEGGTVVEGCEVERDRVLHTDFKLLLNASARTAGIEAWD